MYYASNTRWPLSIDHILIYEGAFHYFITDFYKKKSIDKKLLNAYNK